MTYYDRCYETDKPKIITVYDLIHEKFKDEFNLNNIPKKKILEKADYYICISHNTKRFNQILQYR